MQDIDSAKIGEFLKTYLYLLMAFGLILLFSNGLLGLLIAFVICIPLAFLLCGITDKIGHGWSRLFYGGGKPTWTVQERFQADVDQVMYLKRQKQFPQALRKVNEILIKEPEFAEALFLKAKILWEGYESANGARRYLNMAQNIALPKDHLYRWICSYQDSINETVENKNNLTAGESSGQDRDHCKACKGGQLKSKDQKDEEEIMYARERAEKNYTDQQYMASQQTAMADKLWKVGKWIVFTIALILALRII